MHILLLGSTGRTGIHVLTQALGRGHTVTALVRSPEALELLTADLPADHRANLTILKGTPLSAQDVRRAISSLSSSSATTQHSHRPMVDVVITTLNPRRTSDNPFAAMHPTDSPPRTMADSVRNVIDALAESRTNDQDHQGPQNHHHHNNKRVKVVVLSALGAGRSAQYTHWLLRLLFRHSNMRHTYEDHDAVEKELRDSGESVDFVLVRPTRLADGDGGLARVSDVGKAGVVGLMECVSRGAVARFLVDAAEKSAWDGEAPIVVG